MYSTDEQSTLRTGMLYDVIVVGSRAAGTATAMLLGRGGLRTLLLDDRPLGSDALSTHALMRGGVLQLARWGLLDEVVAAGTPAVRRTTFRHGDENVVISIKPSHGVDALYAPRRTLLDPLLVRAARAAGVEVHHRTSVAGLLVHQGRVVGVDAVTSDGRAVALGAPLVIGADGINSTVAEQVGARFSRVGKHAASTTYGYWSGLATDGYEWNFHPDACSGVIPTNNGQACVFVSASPARIGRGGVSVIREIIGESVPDLARRMQSASAPHGARTWRGHHSYLRRAHGPGWALVGDAGYFKDPLSAHGLTDAFRDAELLTQAITYGFGNHAALDAALAHYQATRDRLSIPLFDVVDRIASQRWGDAEIARLLLRMSSLMADEVEMLAALGADLLQPGGVS